MLDHLRLLLLEGYCAWVVQARESLRAVMPKAAVVAALDNDELRRGGAEAAQVISGEAAVLDRAFGGDNAVLGAQDDDRSHLRAA